MKNKKFYLLCLLLTFLFISGCSLSDITDSFADLASWVVSVFNDVFTDYIPDIACWLLSLLAAAVNAAGSFMTLLVSPMLSVLPEYTLPTVDLGDVPFLSYASYFIPISEGAILVKYLLTFYVSWFVGRVILRWLKVLR